jgi:hypothetical protein
MIVNRKVREPFQVGEWFIEESASTAVKPTTVFKVRNITQSLLLGEAYSFSKTHAAALRRCMPVSIKLISTSSAIKACVFKDQDCQLFYCGNYATNKLLLSRFSWTCLNSQKLNFFDFSVKSVYQAVIERRDKNVLALERWSRILSRPIDHQ